LKKKKKKKIVMVTKQVVRKKTVGKSKLDQISVLLLYLQQQKPTNLELQTSNLLYQII